MSKSDSDDDWFDKDIDDFKVDKLESGVENISFSNNGKKGDGDQFASGPSNFFGDAGKLFLRPLQAPTFKFPQ